MANHDGRRRERIDMRTNVIDHWMQQEYPHFEGERSGRLLDGGRAGEDVVSAKNVIATDFEAVGPDQ
jgi:hypothetical protein